MDNCYTSPLLFTDFSRLNTGACGTARYRKGILQEFKTTQVKRKLDKFAMNSGTLLAVKFKDRTVSQIMSSVHSVNEVEIGRCHEMVAYSCLR